MICIWFPWAPPVLTLNLGKTWRGGASCVPLSNFLFHQQPKKDFWGSSGAPQKCLLNLPQMTWRLFQKQNFPGRSALFREECTNLRLNHELYIKKLYSQISAFLPKNKFQVYVQACAEKTNCFAKRQPGVAGCGWLQPCRNFLSTWRHFFCSTLYTSL